MSTEPKNEPLLSASDPPRYRPRERFWPYVELPEQLSDDEIATLDPDVHAELFGAPQRPFSVTLVFPVLDSPELRPCRRDGQSVGRVPRDWNRIVVPAPRAVLADRCDEAARSVRARRPVRCVRSAHRRSPGPLRARAVAAAHLVLDTAPIATPSGRTKSTRTRAADPRKRPSEAGRGIQHVLLRSASAPAVGDAEPRRGDDQAARSQRHPELRRSLPLHHDAVPIRGVRRSVGSRPACARRGTAGAVCPADAGPGPKRRRRRSKTRSCSSRPSRIR